VSERLSIDDATRAALRARHVAFTKARLLSDTGRAELRKNLEAGFAAVMKRPVKELFVADDVVAFVEHLVSEPVLVHTVRPILRTAILLEAGRLREEPLPAKAYVSSEARASIEKLLERPGIVPAAFVRQLVTHRAFERVMSEVLDDALKQFGGKMNPFTAEWGLPSLTKKTGAFSLGLGAVLKSFENVQQEFERRLEPERKRFLSAFARTALGTVADMIVRGADDPPMVELRKELLAWVLEQPTSELAANWSERNVELGEQIGHELSKHVLGLEATKRRRRATVEMLLGAHGSQSLEEALSKYGARIEPAFDAIVGLLWPTLRVALDTPAVEAWLDEVVGGFWDEV
jgi:hypothetical protein